MSRNNFSKFSKIYKGRWNLIKCELLFSFLDRKKTVNLNKSKN